MHFLKEGQKIRALVDPSPPLIRAMPERKRFFLLMSSLTNPTIISRTTTTTLITNTHRRHGRADGVDGDEDALQVRRGP